MAVTNFFLHYSISYLVQKMLIAVAQNPRWRLKWLVLFTTQRYSVCCHRGLKKAENLHIWKAENRMFGRLITKLLQLECWDILYHAKGKNHTAVKLQQIDNTALMLPHNTADFHRT